MRKIMVIEKPAARFRAGEVVIFPNGVNRDGKDVDHGSWEIYEVKRHSEWTVTLLAREVMTGRRGWFEFDRWHKLLRVRGAVITAIIKEEEEIFDAEDDQADQRR